LLSNGVLSEVSQWHFSVAAFEILDIWQLSEGLAPHLLTLIDSRELAQIHEIRLCE